MGEERAMPRPANGRKVAGEDRLIRRAVARLRAGIMAVTYGMTCGVGLALATAWLLLRGGENVGVHLNLLSQYFPGYSVTWPGVLIGLAYGAVFGAVLGGCLAWLYNWIAFAREPKR